MWITFGVIGGVIAVLLSLLFRHVGFVLFALLAWWLYGWLTTDPIREQHEIELRRDEYERIKDQKRRITASQVQVRFEKYEVREVTATISNGSVARISNVAFKCTYARPDENEPWRLTTPVGTTSVIHPGESKRLSFWLRDAASDAIPSTFECEPSVRMNQADLMRSGLVHPKTPDDLLLARSAIQVETRLGQIRREYAPILARGSITNNSNADIGYLSLSCSALMNELGRVETIYGGTAIHVAPGETKSFDFPVGKMHVENPMFGIRDVSCGVLKVHDSR
ncbi:hypothetical protein [Microvirga sp. VF16]|uniref:hypothetical protein n=1 Tax=Microvirga sp. VF16 TaxID=2807101 RepID=UPI00193D36E3|nr:hypothetical protein [Microvirga sp. VF16]QRM28350.1 hypothetical protein JO965_19225 [Microvirga sp. VF16]